MERRFKSYESGTDTEALLMFPSADESKKALKRVLNLDRVRPRRFQKLCTARNLSAENLAKNKTVSFPGQEFPVRRSDNPDVEKNTCCVYKAKFPCLD